MMKKQSRALIKLTALSYIFPVFVHVSLIVKDRVDREKKRLASTKVLIFLSVFNAWLTGYCIIVSRLAHDSLLRVVW